MVDPPASQPDYSAALAQLQTLLKADAEFRGQHKLETYRSMLSISVEGFKALLLVNGGAVVAVLAYLAEVKNAALAGKAKGPLAYFAVGITLAVLAFLTSYLTQLRLFNEPLNAKTVAGLKPHMWPVVLTTLVAITSLVCFLFGAFAMLDVFASSPAQPS